MNWIRNNPFIAGFVGVLIVCTGLLGFLIFTASGKYSGVRDEYAAQAAELKRLQALSPYPEQANFDKLKAQKDEYVSKINGLIDSVAAMQLPPEQTTPEQFQDQLRAAVTAASARGQQNGTQLFDKFYLGFEDYQSKPPKAEAASPLGRQLHAMELAIGIILDARPAGITAIKRQRLAQEGAATAATSPSPVPAAQPAKKPLVSSSSLEVDLLLGQSQLRSILNQLAAETKQMLVVRSLEIKNEKDKGPTLAEATAAPATAGQPVADAATAQNGVQPAPSAQALRFVVGDEKLLVALKIDIMEFTRPAVAKGK
jgi:hypothetical protein